MSLYETRNVARLERQPRVPNRQFERDMADQERHDREASKRRNEAQARIDEEARLRRIERDGVKKAAALSLAEHIRDYFPMDPETYRKVFAVIEAFEGKEPRGSRL